MMLLLAALLLESPSGVVKVGFEVKEGRAVYTVSHAGKEVIAPSRLGLVFEGAPRLDGNFEFVREARTQGRLSWRPVYGERAEIPDRFNALALTVRETIPPRRELTIEFRAYDEGAAFRYRFTAAAPVVIGEEATEFRLAGAAHAWETPRAQTPYRRVAVEKMAGASERPLLLELANGGWAAIADAGVENYPSMFVAPLRGSLTARLMGPARISGAFASPWRVLLTGSTPGELLEHNYLLQNLSPASRLADGSWIRPGKVLREVTLSTRGGREAVDFAVKNGIQYVEYDAGWYGHEYDEESDATRVSVDPRRLRKEPEYQGLDLPQVIAYAKSKGVGVMLYINRRAMERQLDEVLPLYAKWGVAGVKYGFVNVHTQGWTRWLYDAVAKAARHRLVLDVHDEFRPTGMSRTYPNLLTQEGIRGNEEMPDAEHSTVLPFTRMLAGAADYTFCWLDPRLKNTWGHQMALTVLLYSPLQFVYWYDRPVNLEVETPGMDWLREVPTVWDETRVLGGRPGEFAALARRKGRKWFVGAVTNNEARRVEIAFDFLEAGREYEAELFQDGNGARDVRVLRKKVKKGERIAFDLQARGGVAVRLNAGGV